jgi:uncharacterized protein (DUF1697 family)
MVYVALIRGINVGGNNKVPMAELRKCFEDLAFKNVMTYIASGNVIFESDKSAGAVAEVIEQDLPRKFKLNRELIRVLVLSHEKLKKIVEQAPSDFGGEPGKYHSDAVFLIDKSAAEAMEQIETHHEVDKAWPGEGVIYFQRLSALRTKSRLGKTIGKPIYQNMTIRSWNTTTKLLDLIEQI